MKISKSKCVWVLYDIKQQTDLKIIYSIPENPQE